MIIEAEKWSKGQNWTEMVLSPRNCFAGVTWQSQGDCSNSTNYQKRYAKKAPTGYLSKIE